MYYALCVLVCSCGECHCTLWRATPQGVLENGGHQHINGVGSTRTH